MCTSFRIAATDGSVVVGRTMEFPNALGTKITMLPRDYKGTGIGVDAKPGKQWTSKYGLVGMDTFDHPDMLTDAMNEKGLYAGLLYMPGFCDYTPAEGADPASLASVVNLVAYVLGTSASIEEAKAAMSQVTVWPYVFGPFGFAPPAHLVMHDSSGGSAVFEWRKGTMEVFDNPIGVACNWPHLDWHLTNLRNYINLAVKNPSPITIEGVELSAMGQGPGMNGLPGDSSSPARFVRAVAFTSSLRPVETGPELEKTALHILNNFDIPYGLIREDDKPANDDHTLWSSVSNLKDLRYAIRSYDNPNTQVVDLKALDFTAPGPKQVALPEGVFTTLDL